MTEQPLSQRQLETLFEEIRKEAKKSPKKTFTEFIKLVGRILCQYGFDHPAKTVTLIGKIFLPLIGSKMKSGGGKQKGASFEREICVALSKWITDGEEEDVFWRSAMSGGRATVALKKGKKLTSQSSDITATKAIGELLTKHFSIECKFYADLSLEPFFYGAKSGFRSFWQQVNEDAATFGKMPMLIAKQNRRDILLVLDDAGVSFFTDLYGKLPIHLKMLPLGMSILFFDKFLEFADPEALILTQEQPRKRVRIKVKKDVNNN